MAYNLTISYDLKSPGRNYDAVSAKIKELGSWAKVNESYWYVSSEFTASQARDRILSALDVNDSLCVVSATQNQAAWHNLSSEVANFLKQHWK